MGYHGEVNVAQEELNSFLAVAEDLEVKGLTQNNSSSHRPRQDHPQSSPLSSSAYAKPKQKEPEPPAPPLKRPRPPVTQPSYQQNDDDDILEVLPTVKTEPIASTIPYQPNITNPSVQSHTEGIETMGSMGMQVTNMEESYGEDGYDYWGYEGDGQGYEGMAGLDPGIVDHSKDVVDSFAERIERGKYVCKLCEFAARDKYNIRLHIERKHDLSSGYQCPFCNKCVKTKQDLSQHKSLCDLRLKV